MHYVACKIIHSEGSDSQQWETCQAKLSKVLVEKCSETKVLEVRKYDTLSINILFNGKDANSII